MAVVRNKTGYLGGAPITTGVDESDPQDKQYPLLVNLYGVDTQDGSFLAGPYLALKPLIFEVDTSIYAPGDVFSNVLAVPDFFPENGAIMWLDHFTILDKDDDAPFDMRLWVLGANTPIGTLNNQPNISDSNAAHPNVQHYIDISFSSAIDLGGCKFYQGAFSPRKVIAPVDSRILYLQLQIGAIGTPTIANASDIIGAVGGYR